MEVAASVFSRELALLASSNKLSRFNGFKLSFSVPELLAVSGFLLLLTTSDRIAGLSVVVDNCTRFLSRNSSGETAIDTEVESDVPSTLLSTSSPCDGGISFSACSRARGVLGGKVTLRVKLLPLGFFDTRAGSASLTVDRSRGRGGRCAREE